MNGVKMVLFKTGVEFSTIKILICWNCGKIYVDSGKVIVDLQKVLKEYILFVDMPKRTFQPHTRHRAKTHGFRARVSTKAGRLVLKRRRLKGRAKIAI